MQRTAIILLNGFPDFSMHTYIFLPNWHYIFLTFLPPVELYLIIFFKVSIRINIYQAGRQVCSEGSIYSGSIVFLGIVNTEVKAPFM